MKKSVALLITLCMVLSLIPFGMVVAEDAIGVTADPASETTHYSTDFTKVTLTFESEITLAEETALTDVITLAKDGGAAVEITATTEDNIVVEVAFGALEEGAYTLTVDAAVTGAEEATTFTYTVKQLLFELEIKDAEGYTLTEGAAIDASNVDATAATKANLNSALSLEGITSNHTDKPIYHEEGEVKYLKFVDENDANAALNGYNKEDHRIVVPFKSELDIANKDALTFETWIRPNRNPNVTGTKTDYNRVFSFGSARGIEGVTTENRLFEFVWMVRNTSSGGPRFENDLENSDTNDRTSFYNVTESGTTNAQPIEYMEEFEEKWMHLVLTREWKEVTAPVYDESGNVTTAGTGTWTNKIFINGAYRGSVTSGTTEEKTIVPTSVTDPMNHLCIGGLTGAAEAFRGDIAEFKMYDGVLTEDTVRASYQAKRDTYFPANGRKVFGMQINDTSTGADLVTATDDSTSTGLMVPTAMDVANTVAPTRMEENGVEFLRFASLNTTTNEFENLRSQVTVRLSDFEIADETEITVEAWVRPDYSLNTNKSGATNFSGRMSLFSVGRHPKWGPLSGGTNLKDAYRVQFEDAKTEDTVTSYGTMVFSNKTDRGEKATIADLSAHDGQWHHYVITRTWSENNPTEEYPTRGIWTHKLYVDGVLTATASVNSNERLDYSEMAYNNNRAYFRTSDYLAIGGSACDLGNPAFHGDIAEFALYAGELSADTIRTKYLESPTALTGLKDFNFVDGNGAILTEDTITGAAEIGVIGSVEMTEEATAPFVMLAVYTGENGDVLHGCIKLEANVEDGVLKVADDTITGLADKNITYAKLFIWDGVSSIRPLFSAYCL